MYSVILAGGGGVRLWPISTIEEPKQFIKLHGNSHSLFEQAVLRCLKISEAKDIFIVGNKNYEYEIMAQLDRIGYSEIGKNLLLEPCPKNTLSAICYAMKQIEQLGGGPVGIFPSDHSILNVDAFVNDMHLAESICQRYLVTFGIKPGLPKTCYGYIHPGRQMDGYYEIQRFVEKPDAQTARTYVENGYFYNSGMFVFGSKLFLQKVKELAPETYSSFFEHDDIEEIFALAPSISIDYAIMEKTDNAAVVPAGFAWSDLGGYEALFEYYSDKADQRGNVALGHVEYDGDTEHTFIYTGGRTDICVIGMKDVVIAEDNGKILVSRLDKLDHLKGLSEKLQKG